MLHVKHSSGGGYNFTVVSAVEIDKYPVASYNAIYDDNIEPQDITNYFPTTEELGEIDLIWNSSPCQDISVAGKGAGAVEGSGTRSSLVYEAIRVIKALKPKYIVWENVKGLTTKKHRHVLDDYIEKLNDIGYHSQFQILNAKDYGIPQNRERVFTVSVRNDVLESFELPFPEKQELELKLKDMLEDEVDEKYYLSDKMIKYISANNEKWVGNNNQSLINKNIASTISTGEGNKRCDASNYICDELPDNYDLKNSNFQFPPKQELKLKLKDILEDEVDEKYYLSDERINKIKTSKFSQEKKIIQTKEYCDSLLARDWKGPKCVEVSRKYGIFDDDNSKHQAGSVYDENGLCPTLDTMQGGWRQPCVEIKSTTNNKDEELQNQMPHLKSKCKRLQKLIEKTNFEEGKVLNMDLYNQTTNEKISQCLTEPHHNTQRIFDGLRIRKLTPKECWRLMGFDDEDYEKASKVNSASQLYKQAGNSVVVNVIEAIFDNLLVDYQTE